MSIHGFSISRHGTSTFTKHLAQQFTWFTLPAKPRCCSANMIISFAGSILSRFLARRKQRHNDHRHNLYRAFADVVKLLKTRPLRACCTIGGQQLTGDILYFGPRLGGGTSSVPPGPLDQLDRLARTDYCLTASCCLKIMARPLRTRLPRVDAEELIATTDGRSFLLVELAVSENFAEAVCALDKTGKTEPEGCFPVISNSFLMR